MYVCRLTQLCAPNFAAVKTLTEVASWGDKNVCARTCVRMYVCMYVCRLSQLCAPNFDAVKTLTKVSELGG